RSDGIGALQLLHQGRAEVGRQLRHRGHRPGPDHQEPRRRADRHRLPDHRRGGPADPVRPDRARGTGAGRLERDQHRGRDAAGQGPRAGQDGGDDPRRWRQPLSVEALQSGLPAREEPAAAALDEVSDAAALDAADPLRPLRERFELPAGVIYLDGNSLGPPPKAVFAELEQAARREWGEGLIRSWNDAGWFTLTDTLGDRIGGLIGADAGQTVVSDSTSINVFKTLHAALALRPGRSAIVAEADSFPTDLYMAEGVVASRPGATLRQATTDAELDALIDGRAAVVLLNHVDYRSGR